MTIFLILAPYGAFAFLMLVTSSAASLLAAAAICFAIIVLDLARGHSVKILGAGSVVTFATVGSYVWFVDPSLSVSAVKLSVDAGVLLVVLLSIAVPSRCNTHWRRSAPRSRGCPASSTPTTSSPGRGPPRCWR
jgi:hypothetical protein